MLDQAEEFILAATLLSASDYELTHQFRMTRIEAVEEARRVAGDAWVDNWLEMNA